MLIGVGPDGKLVGQDVVDITLRDWAGLPLGRSSSSRAYLGPVLFVRALHNELCRAAYASTLEFFKEHFPGLQGAVPAMVVSPQSHGSSLNFHPHWHAIVSLGVFDRRESFHGAPGDLDFSPLEELFRERTFKAMLE